MRALLLSLSLFIAGSLWQSPQALAQDTPPESSPAVINQANQLLQSAELAYRAGDFSSALEDYSLSYSLSQDPQILFSIAQCQHQLRDYQDAIQSYQSFLARASASLDDEARQEIESLIMEAEELDKQERPKPKTSDPSIDPEPREFSLLWAQRPPRSSAPYFAVSGLALVSAAICATFSVQTANNVEVLSTDELISSDELRRGRSLSLLLAASADALILTSAITGTIGVVKWHDQKRELSAKASASSLWIQLRY